ncbi:MAG: putative acetyltransferase [Candidatus Latescibacterota bacterium]|jgi:putative acetyltransferase
MIEIKRTNSENQDFIALVKFLDADLKIRDGDEHDFFNQYNKLDTIKNVVLAYLDGHVAGCGAFKLYENTTIEIKRMFTTAEARGNGIGTLTLSELEKWALAEGFTHAILETGYRMSEAIGLYTKSGYEQIPNYGQYVHVDASRCFKKELK